MKYPYSETGERILNLRKKYGLTRERLAEKADISVQFLADIEKGRKNMTVTTLRKLSSALCVTTDYIVNGYACEDENDLIELCKTLSSKNQDYAVKFLKLLVEITGEK